MNALFQRSNITPLILSLQKLLKNTVNDSNYEELEGYINQLMKYQQDQHAINLAIDASIIVAVTDLKGDILYVNNKFCEISKYSRSELMGENHRIVNSGYHSREFFKDMWKTIGNGKIWEGEVKNKAKDGSYYWVKTTIVPILENGKPIMYISLRTDITEGKLAQEKLYMALKNDFRVVVNSMYNMIFKIKKQGHQKFIYTFSEGKLANELELQNQNVRLKSPIEVFPAKLGDWLEEKYREAFSGETVTYTYDYNGKNLLTYLSPVYEGEEIVEIIGCISDISELHQAQEEIKFMAYHDMLTNLPNRRKFNEDMEELISKSLSEERNFAVLFLDLDRFKQINDSLGHTVGDLLLKAVSSRLQNIVGNMGQIYRFTGDEFIIVFSNYKGKTDLERFTEGVLLNFENVFLLENSKQIFTTLSIGISTFPEHGKDAESLLKNADTAMFTAKENGRNTYAIYEPSMNQHHEETLAIDQFLRKAIENNEFELHYQPKMDLSTGKVQSMEALLRWNNPQLGNVKPDKFIPIAEEMGLIIKIDEWVLEQACRQNKEWNETLFSNRLRVAVNISPLHFRLPTFVDLVEKTLEKTGLAPELLEIEMTESSFIENTDICIQSLRKLRELGVYVAIDDFGTGYSSLNYLRKFPITSLKIDRSFIQEISQESDEIAIVKSMIYLSRELNLKVVAEGTETKEVIDVLKDLGCNEVQGFYISKPVPKNEFERLVKKINDKN